MDDVVGMMLTLSSGSWKTVHLKPYNFKSKGALTPSGALHPCRHLLQRKFALVEIGLADVDGLQ